MTVLILTACPAGLIRVVTRWLLEIAPGVFVGRVSSRVRQKLWDRTVSLVRGGRAIMVYSARNEQHLAFEVFQPDWEPIDRDGVELIRRPIGSESASLVGPPRKGWSNASRQHKARKFG